MNNSSFGRISSIHSNEEESQRSQGSIHLTDENLDDFINTCKAKSHKGGELMAHVKKDVIDDLTFYMSGLASSENSKNLKEQLKAERKDIENKIQAIKDEIAKADPNSLGDAPPKLLDNNGNPSPEIQDCTPTSHCMCGCLSKVPRETEGVGGGGGGLNVIVIEINERGEMITRCSGDAKQQNLEDCTPTSDCICSCLSKAPQPVSEENRASRSPSPNSKNVHFSSKNNI